MNNFAKYSAKYSLGLCLSFVAASLAYAGPDDFKTGPVFENYGKTAPVETDFKVPSWGTLKVLFDVAGAAKPGEVNRNLDSAARLINMHAASGTKPKKIKVAIVVHGPAAIDLTKAERYSQGSDGKENASAPLISALTEQGVRVILCGQTAAYRDIKNEDLLPGVEMALSAMTAHAVLQYQGYTLNPF